MTADTFTIVRAGAPIDQGRRRLLSAEHALVIAQDIAARAAGETSLTVERSAPYGPPATLYRIVRDEAGTVLTYPIERQD